MGTDSHLFHKVMGRIVKEKARQARRWFVLHASLFLSSVIALIFGFRYLLEEFYTSGFSRYITLVISDSGFVMRFWQDFLLSLAESLPVVGGAVVLAAIFAVLLSLQRIVRDLEIMQLTQ